MDHESNGAYIRHNRLGNIGTGSLIGVDQKLIPKDGFWGTVEQSAMTREDILTKAASMVEIEVHRYFVGPNEAIGLSSLVTTDLSSPTMWFMTAYRGSACVATKQATNIFDVMVFFDFWVGEFRQ